MILASQPVIAIVGPTAIGKTACGIELVSQLGGAAEIVSADSVQVYRGLEIGSAKPSAAERAQAWFHLIDIADPDQEFSLADFQNAAQVVLDGIRSRENRPIVVGGTGLYIRALTQPLGLPHVPPDQPLRERWMAYAEKHGRSAVHEILAERDPETAVRLHANDLKRVTRALEVLEHTGRTLSEWHRGDRESGSAMIPDVRLFGLNRERASLNQAIDARVDAMMAAGFLDEVRRLRAAGYSRSLKSMQTLGYNELNAFCDGEMDLPAAVDAIKLHTRQFARRQLIWFRADPRIIWIDVADKSAFDIAEAILHQYNE